MAEVDAFVQEQSALVNKKTVYEIYKIATEEPYSFLFVKLRMSDLNKIFYDTLRKGNPHNLIILMSLILLNQTPTTKLNSR